MPFWEALQGRTSSVFAAFSAYRCQQELKVGAGSACGTDARISETLLARALLTLSFKFLATSRVVVSLQSRCCLNFSSTFVLYRARLTGSKVSLH